MNFADLIADRSSAGATLLLARAGGEAVGARPADWRQMGND